MLDNIGALRYTIPMLYSTLLHIIAGIGIFAIGFCVTFTFLTIKDNLAELRKLDSRGTVNDNGGV